MFTLDVEQLSDEWFEARCGIPTASCFDKIVTSRGAMSTQAKSYLYQLAGESLIGIKTETYQNAAMQRGIELEGEAINLYELMNDVEVERVGICFSDETRRFSCSPDGLVGEDGGLEIKCPLIHTHIEYLLGGKLPTKYIQQIQGALLITDRKWWDFMSYYPGLKPLVVRVERDETFIEKLSTALIEFTLELEETIAKLRLL